MGQEWVTVSQACLTYGVSRRTLTRWIKQGKLKSRLDGNRRLVLISDVRHGETDQGHDDSGVSQQALIEQLRSEIARLEKQLETKDKQIEREQMISMQLTRQIESQRMLEAPKERRGVREWFSRLWKQRLNGHK